jgi:hypothetical protein
MTIDVLFHSPIEYFRQFDKHHSSLWVALGSFLLLALGQVATAGEPPSLSELPLAVMWVLLNWIFGVVFFGVIWFFLGAKALGGKADLATTVRAVGYAFLIPAIVALIVSALTAAFGDSSPGGAMRMLAINGLLGLWSLCVAGIAIRFVHSLSWQRATLVVLWMPAFLLLLWLFIAVIIICAVPFLLE